MRVYHVVKRPFLNPKNEEVMNEFLLYQKLANRSPYTIETYRYCLQNFFVDKEELFSSLSADKMLGWLKEHRGKIKESTLLTKMSILSSFFAFCVNEEYMERSPLKSWWFPRLPKALPKNLEKGDVAKIRQEAERSSLRDRALLEFMLTSGCRVGEIHRLNYKDLDFAKRTAGVIGKGGKIRQVHFSEKCAVLLEKYLDSHPKTTQALFVTKETRMSIRTMQRVMRDLGKKAGLSSPLHPHRCRHTFATELLANGAELSFIADELGHSEIATTQIYARLPKKEIISEYRKYMG